MLLKEKLNVIQSFPGDERCTTPHRAMGEAPVLVMRLRRTKEKAKVRAFTGVSTGKTRQGRGNSIGLASFNDSGRL